MSKKAPITPPADAPGALNIEPSNDFNDAVKPKKLKGADELFLFKCECGNVHVRHAGYVESLMPLIQADKKKKVVKDSYAVHVCTKCKRAYIWYDCQMYDVTELIDLNAWEKTEKELHAATGPGGQC